jgi:hypothetical protein
MGNFAGAEDFLRLKKIYKWNITLNYNRNVQNTIHINIKFSCVDQC